LNEPLISARELGEQLGLSTATVLDWWEADRLPGFRLGGRKGGPVRFRLSEVEGVLEEWRCGPTPRREPEKVL
jgi:predicted DNA-binding transcriptional regulator AlpA